METNDNHVVQKRQIKKNMSIMIYNIAKFVQFKVSNALVESLITACSIIIVIYYAWKKTE